MNLTGKQFRMTSNMKAAPNSQGTLFQGVPAKPGGAGQDWPRRYSPQRRDEVVGALRNHEDVQEDLKGHQKAEGWSTQTGDALAQQAHGISAIARSTVPVEHLQGGLRISWGVGSASGNTLGEYHRYGRYGTQKEPSGPPWGGPDISIERKLGNEHTPTVIHEIGHHVSATVDKNPHAEYDSPANRGQEEGFAENYAETHFRDKTGKPIEHYQTDPSGWAARESARGEGEFIQHFTAQRTRSPGFQRDLAKGAATYASRRRGVQTELLHRMNSGDGGYRDEPSYHWDYNEEHNPRGLERRVTGRMEADRRDRRDAEKAAILEHPGWKSAHSPQFNVFGPKEARIDLNQPATVEESMRGLRAPGGRAPRIERM